MALDKDDIKQLIAILQKGLVEEDDEENIEVKPIRKKSPKAKTSKTKKTNLFDNMSESSMHKDDIEIDKRLRKAPPTQRSRNYKPLKVRCRVCGKEELTNPSLVESIERYKCNKCSTTAG
jgi:lysyl-tRNA synthetase class I